MKKLLKNVLLLGVVTTLSVTTVYGESYKNLESLKQVDLKKFIKNKNTTTNTNAPSQNVYSELNTNVDDIRSLSFYKTELSSDESSIDLTDNMLKNVKFTQLDKPKKGDLVAVIETSEGTIKVKFLPEVAPKAVKNFVEHSLNGYYDGLTFHRVIDDFVAQGGDPLGTGTGGTSIWNKPFVIEANPRARHFSGALAMANSGSIASNGSQFYFVDDVKLQSEILEELNYFKAHQEDVYKHMHPAIKGEENVYHQGDILIKDIFPAEAIESYKNVGGTPFLDFGYTIFGQTYEGLDVIDKITEVKVDEKDKPVNPVIIKKITVGIVK